MTPKSLAEVAEATAEGDSFERSLANFLDQFYAGPSADALNREPLLLEPVLGDAGQVQDAYLAATAEALARAYRFPCPRWTVSESRKLHRPWFASQLASLRAVLL